VAPADDRPASERLGNQLEKPGEDASDPNAPRHARHISISKVEYQTNDDAGLLSETTALFMNNVPTRAGVSKLDRSQASSEGRRSSSSSSHQLRYIAESVADSAATDPVSAADASGLARILVVGVPHSGAASFLTAFRASHQAVPEGERFSALLPTRWQYVEAFHYLLCAPSDGSDQALCVEAAASAEWFKSTLGSIRESVRRLARINSDAKLEVEDDEKLTRLHEVFEHLGVEQPDRSAEPEPLRDLLQRLSNQLPRKSPSLTDSPEVHIFELSSRKHTPAQVLNKVASIVDAFSMHRHGHAHRIFRPLALAMQDRPTNEYHQVLVLSPYPYLSGLTHHQQLCLIQRSPLLAQHALLPYIRDDELGMSKPFGLRSTLELSSDTNSDISYGRSEMPFDARSEGPVGTVSVISGLTVGPAYDGFPFPLGSPSVYTKSIGSITRPESQDSPIARLFKVASLPTPPELGSPKSPPPADLAPPPPQPTTEDTASSPKDLTVPPSQLTITLPTETEPRAPPNLAPPPAPVISLFDELANTSASPMNQFTQVGGGTRAVSVKISTALSGSRTQGYRIAQLFPPKSQMDRDSTSADNQHLAQRVEALLDNHADGVVDLAALSRLRGSAVQNHHRTPSPTDSLISFVSALSHLSARSGNWLGSGYPFASATGLGMTDSSARTPSRKYGSLTSDSDSGSYSCVDSSSNADRRLPSRSGQTPQGQDKLTVDSIEQMEPTPLQSVQDEQISPPMTLPVSTDGMTSTVCALPSAVHPSTFYDLTHHVQPTTPSSRLALSLLEEITPSSPRAEHDRPSYFLSPIQRVTAANDSIEKTAAAAPDEGTHAKPISRKAASMSQTVINHLKALWRDPAVKHKWARLVDSTRENVLEFYTSLAKDEEPASFAHSPPLRIREILSSLPLLMTELDYVSSADFVPRDLDLVRTANLYTCDDSLPRVWCLPNLTSLAYCANVSYVEPDGRNDDECSVVSDAESSFHLHSNRISTQGKALVCGVCKNTSCNCKRVELRAKGGYHFPRHFPPSIKAPVQPIRRMLKHYFPPALVLRGSVTNLPCDMLQFVRVPSELPSQPSPQPTRQRQGQCRDDSHNVPSSPASDARSLAPLDSSSNVTSLSTIEPPSTDSELHTLHGSQGTQARANPHQIQRATSRSRLTPARSSAFRKSGMDSSATPTDRSAQTSGSSGNMSVITVSGAEAVGSSPGFVPSVQQSGFLSILDATPYTKSTSTLLRSQSVIGGHHEGQDAAFESPPPVHDTKLISSVSASALGSDLLTSSISFDSESDRLNSPSGTTRLDRHTSRLGVLGECRVREDEDEDEDSDELQGSVSTGFLGGVRFASAESQFANSSAENRILHPAPVSRFGNIVLSGGTFTFRGNNTGSLKRSGPPEFVSIISTPTPNPAGKSSSEQEEHRPHSHSFHQSPGEAHYANDSVVPTGLESISSSWKSIRSAIQSVSLTRSPPRGIMLIEMSALTPRGFDEHFAGEQLLENTENIPSPVGGVNPLIYKPREMWFFVDTTAFLPDFSALKSISHTSNLSHPPSPTRSRIQASVMLGFSTDLSTWSLFRKFCLASQTSSMKIKLVFGNLCATRVLIAHLVIPSLLSQLAESHVEGGPAELSDQVELNRLCDSVLDFFIRYLQRRFSQAYCQWRHQPAFSSPDNEHVADTQCELEYVCVGSVADPRDVNAAFLRLIG